MLIEPLLLHVEAHWVCPWAMSCYVALREKELPFHTSNALLSDEQELLPSYRALTITGRVPALQHGSFCVAESSAIVEYLEDAFPPPQFARVLPHDPKERARARQVMAWLRSSLHALRDEWDASLIFYPIEVPPALSREAEKDVATLVSVAERLVAKGKRSICGDWCIADADLAFALRRLIVNRYPLAAHLGEYAQAIWERPSIREFAEHGRPPHSRFASGHRPPRV
jgi:glutathione S-transferase